VIRSLRGHGASILVAALSSAFGVALLEVTSVLAQLIRGDDVTGSSHTVAILLQVLAFVFIVIAVYVGAIVTANTFATIIAGRRRTIALLRLIGSSARTQRAAVAREGLLVGVVGSIIGAAAGTGLTALIVAVGTATKFIPGRAYSVIDAEILLPIVAVVLTTWAASWIGSRRVLHVSPIEAAGVSVERSLDEATGRRGRNTTALVLAIIGGAFLVLAILVGLVTPLGVLIGVVGGIVSFSGVVLGAQRIMPAALRLVGRAFGSSPTARLAAENAIRYPERSARTTIGLVIGVTLVTMFAVAVQSFQVIIAQAQAAQPQVYEGTNQTLQVVVAIFSVLMGFSALIAAVGMVNALSLSVLQRTRELGLLRALGFTARQVRSMVLAESAQLTIAAVLVGLVLGTFYGWVGAQSLLGSINGLPGIVAPGIPLPLFGVIVLASVLLIAVASVAPSRRATRITPVAALAIE
jgi:putative ABC transport system permease protein